MSTFLYELPTTGAISFTDFCVDQTASYTSDIAAATQARANLRAALKESKRTDGEKDYLRLVKVVDDYLPHLYGIKACFDAEEIVLSSEPVFSWRTPLAAHLLPSSPRLSLPSLHADLLLTLSTYASTLSNLARTNVAALGTYERERSTNDVERRAKDERLNFAVTLLRRASGVFRHLSEVIVPEWEKLGGPGAQRPPEVTSEVTSALAKMALADAQQLAIRKLLTRAAYDSTISPGPPLPKSRPSPALIAKLYLECAELYSSARALAKTPGKAAGVKSPNGKPHTAVEVSPELRHYLASEAALSTALAHKWLGVDAGENGGQAQGGIAVAFLAWAKSGLEALKDGGAKSAGIGHIGGIGVGKSEKEGKDKRKERVADELESVTMFFKHYKKINDSLHFQPVPKTSELQASIPAGRPAFEPVPYAPPSPAFGPGSVEYTRRQAEVIELAEEAQANAGAGDENTVVEVKAGSPKAGGTYAGQGSYF